MGLFKKLFGGGSDASKPGGASSQFHESETTAQRVSSVNAPRRELVHVVLRDTMRKHGVPSDWMDCRILSVVTRKRQAGLHVQFIVRQGEEKLLPYVHAFQDTFWQELEKFETHPREWLFSLAWQFEGKDAAAPDLMADANDWSDDTQPPQDTQPPEEDPDELATDLQALYAIRDAALSDAAPTTDPPQAKPPGRS